LGIALSCALLFPACPSPAGDNGSETADDDDGWEEDDAGESAPRIAEGVRTDRTVTLTGMGVVRYFSLATGKAVTNPKKIASQAWDLAFFNTRLIYTNSGVTATELGSGGKGGVWYTDKSFAEAGWEDRVTDDPLYQPYETDVYRFAYGMTGGEESTYSSRRKMNVMTFMGYDNENEEGAGFSEERPFSLNYRYNKKGFYVNEMDPVTGMGIMPPLFSASGQVYIIRHGDGKGYSKFQVTQFDRDPGNRIDTHRISWENFFPEDK
jgi:hypothetical protein